MKQTKYLLFLIMIFVCFNFSVSQKKKLKFQYLYREQQFAKLFKLTKNNTSLSFLNGQLLVYQKQYHDAVNYFLQSTNNNLTRDYSFSKIADVYYQLSNWQCTNIWKRLYFSDNHFIQYQSSIKLAEFYFERKQFSKAYPIFLHAYKIDKKLNKKYNQLYKIFGRYYRSKNLYYLYATSRKIDKTKSMYFVLILLQSKPSKRNPYLKKICMQLKNEQFSQYAINFYLAKHLFVFKKTDTVIPKLLQKAIIKSHTKENLYKVLEIFFKYYLATDRKQLQPLLNKYQSTFIGSIQYDDFLYYRALLQYYKKDRKKLNSLLHTILYNKIKNKETENKAISLYLKWYKKQNSVTQITKLFEAQKNRIRKSNVLSQRFFEFAVNNFYETNTSLFLSVVTNIAERSEYEYFAGVGLLQQKKYKQAYSFFAKVIKKNTSSFYSALSGQKIEEIYKKDGILKKNNRFIAKTIWHSIDIEQDSIRKINNKYLSILSLNPKYKIKKKQVEKIILKNKKINSLLQKKSANIEVIKFYIEHFMWDAVDIEVLKIKFKNLSSYIKLTTYFSKMNFPYLSLRYANKIKYSLGITIPIYMMQHPYARYLFPKPYSHEINKMLKKTKLSAHFIYALMRTESLFKYDAVSFAGASGLMQIMPSTFKYVAKKIHFKYDTVNKVIFIPTINIKIGTTLLKDLFRQFKNPFYATAGYNAGGGAVRRWLKKSRVNDDIVFVETIPYLETEYYIKKIYYAKKCYDALY